jgi:succinoglycan biosynthesis protein ExoA
VGEGGFVDHGHHALMALDLFRAVGGYRADMSHNEDAELDHRLAARGGRIWLEPSLALGYYPRDNAPALWRQYFAYGRGRARTLALHGMQPKLRQMLPVAVPLAAGCALAAPLWPYAAIPLASWATLCFVWGVGAGVRAGGGCRMAAGGAAAIMHMAWGLGFLAGKLRQRKGTK